MTSRGPGRRLVLVAPLMAAGCGWHPLYGGGSGGPAQKELAAINVALIPERSGQLLRLALQERFERFGLSDAKLYDLVVSFGINSEGIAIRQDSTVTRIRMTGVADWKLIGQTPTRATVTSGFARAVDGLDVIDQQLFAADMQSDAVTRRLAGAVADQISEQLASFFRKRTDAG